MLPATGPTQRARAIQFQGFHDLQHGAIGRECLVPLTEPRPGEPSPLCNVAQAAAGRLTKQQRADHQPVALVWKTLAQAQVYIDMADQIRMAEEAMEKLDAYERKQDQKGNTNAPTL